MSLLRVSSLLTQMLSPHAAGAVAVVVVSVGNGLLLAATAAALSLWILF